MKTIQVPMDEVLLGEIAQRAKTEFKNRSAFIRTACQYFIKYLDKTKKEEEYAKGYRKMPEKVEMARMSSTIVTELMQKEQW
ncbi:MAG: hypothetical protein V1749_05480 [Candidatus Desantisbacteria bacterium]